MSKSSVHKKHVETADALYVSIIYRTHSTTTHIISSFDAAGKMAKMVKKVIYASIALNGNR